MHRVGVLMYRQRAATQHYCPAELPWYSLRHLRRRQHRKQQENQAFDNRSIVHDASFGLDL